MSAVDTSECHVLADLARLSLTDDEAEAFSGQLDRILGYIEQLATVDVEGIPEFSSAEKPDSALRPDLAGPTLTVDEALAAVPAREGSLVAVPKFKED